MAVFSHEPATARSGGPASPRTVLTVIPGGRNQPEVVSIERRAWDETVMDLRTLEHEAFQHVARNRPRVRRLWLMAHEIGPEAEQLVASVLASLDAYERKFLDRPSVAA